MTEQLVQMGPMWLLAGLGAGWLAEAFLTRRGYGLIVDLALGVGAGVVGGGLFLALAGRPVGMLGAFGVGLALAAGVILAQRAWWPRAPGAQQHREHLRLVELGGHSAAGPTPGRTEAGEARPHGPVSARVLMRMATTGIYLLRGVPRELQRAARVRAVHDGTTLRQVLLTGLGEYAAGTWTPQPADRLPGAPAGYSAPPSARASAETR